MNNEIKLETQEYSQNNNLRFWLFQLCGWLPFGLLLIPVFGGDDWLATNPLIFASSITFVAVIGSLQIRKLFKFLNKKQIKSGVWVLLTIFSGLPIAVAVGILHYGFWFIISIGLAQFNPIYQSQPFTAISGLIWFVYIFWSSLYLLLTRQEKLDHSVVKQQQLELLIKETKIKGLLEQLNPHFMFNTINNIRALILKDTEQAREMLSSFADIMRYQININDEALVPLKEELDFVLEYIELNRLQLGKRLNFEQEIDSALLGNIIPRMALQLLVENALKHGFGQSAKPATLKISIGHQNSDENPQAWFLSVKNSGRIKKKKSDSGIGLQNLEDRLKLSFPNNYQLTLIEENEMVECKILFNY